LRRGLLSRAIPGSVVVVAALTVPEFSMGAGNIDTDNRRAKPPEPRAQQGQGLGRLVPDVAKAPLAGVRYGGMVAIREASQTPSGGSSRDDWAGANPAQRAGVPAALAVAPAIRKAKRLEGGANSMIAASDPLDDAASFAATLLDSMATEPGLQPATPVETPSVTYAKPEPIDMAVSYAAMTLDRFAAGTEAGGIAQVVAMATYGAVVPDPILTPARVAAPSPESAPPEMTDALSPAAPLDQEMTEPGLPSAPETAEETAPGAEPLTGPDTPVEAVADVVPPIAAPAQAEPPVAVPVATSLAATPAPREPMPMAYDTSASAAAKRSAPLAFDLRSQLAARVDGKAAGTVDFRQTTIGLSIRLGSIVSLLSDRYDPDEVARLNNSPASNAYISLADLQAQGVPIRYDPVQDEFNIGKADTRAAQPLSETPATMARS
jgi:hypothetical protein